MKLILELQLPDKKSNEVWDVGRVLYDAAQKFSNLSVDYGDSMEIHDKNLNYIGFGKVVEGDVQPL